MTIQRTKYILEAVLIFLMFYQYQVLKLLKQEIGKERQFKASINFSWIKDDGNLVLAPHSQLILYQNIQKLDFPVFLKGSLYAPSELMTQRLADRVLFISVSNTGQILGYVAHPEINNSKEFDKKKDLEYT